jgi:hypothetical protein
LHDRAESTKFAGPMLRVYVLILVVCQTVSLVAQDAARARGEGQLWLSAEVQWRPVKRWSFSGSYVLRTHGALQDVKGAYFYLSARRKLSDLIQVDGKLRYVNSPINDFFRAEGGVRFRKKLGKDAIYFRSAYFHEERKLFWTEGMPRVPGNYWRNRIHFTKDLPKKFSAFASAEMWTQFRFDGIGLRRMALMTGLRRDLKKGRRVSLTYLYQPEFAQRAPGFLNGMIMGFEWDITRRKKSRSGNDDDGGSE